MLSVILLALANVREDGEWLVDEVQLNNLVSSQGAG